MRAIGMLCAATLAATALGPAAALAAPDGQATLLSRAILPSDAYQPGPVSGTAIAADNGVTPPFAGQPIPGFSAVLDAGDGEFWAMPDNGYGAKGNSADFLLRLYRIAPDFRTARGGSGAVDVLGFLSLRDPDRRVPFALRRPDRLADRRRLRPGVRSPREGRLVLVGRGVRALAAAHRRDRQVLDGPFGLPVARSIDGPPASDARGRPARRPRPAAADRQRVSTCAPSATPATRGLTERTRRFRMP